MIRFLCVKYIFQRIFLYTYALNISVETNISEQSYIEGNLPLKLTACIVDSIINAYE